MWKETSSSKPLIEDYTDSLSDILKEVVVICHIVVVNLQSLCPSLPPGCGWCVTCSSVSLLCKCLSLDILLLFPSRKKEAQERHEREIEKREYREEHQEATVKEDVSTFYSYFDLQEERKRSFLFSLISPFCL